MTKREIIKKLKSEYNYKKRSDFSHDLIVVINEAEYHIKILNTSANIQLTLNSKYIWDLKRGRVAGLIFKGYSSTLIDVRNFMKKSNRIVILTNKPYKILMYLNESEIVDVSDKEIIHETRFIDNFGNIKL